MHLLRESHHQVGWITGRVHHPRHSATFIVKGTYDLVPGGRAVPVAEQPELSPDVHEHDDPSAALRYPSDFAYFKPGADVVLVGHFHSPGGSPVTSAHVSLAVGELSKRLTIVGDRVWASTDGRPTATRPAAMTTMDLSYARSFGGPDFAANPIGLGSSGSPGDALPNIEDPADRILQPDSLPTPAGFGPIPLTWPQRRSKAGTYDEQWKRSRWPWFPEDFDWAFFNVAPPDQRLGEFLSGDEPLHLTNMHPEIPTFASELPAERPRCFYAPVVGAPLYFTEVPLNLDTLWIDADAMQIALIWRGVVDLRGDALGGQDRLLVASERLDEPPLPREHYEELCVLRMNALLEPDAPELQEPPPEPELSSDGEDGTAGPGIEAAALTAEIGAFDVAADGADVAEPAPPTREWCLAHHAAGGGFEGRDLTGVDLCDLSLAGARFGDAILAGAYLRRAGLQGADLSGAVLAGADLTDADLTEATLENADLTGARLVRCTLEKAHAAGADFTGATLRDGRLGELQARGAILAGANLLGADLEAADLSDADLSGSVLHMADLSRAILRNASLEETHGFPVMADGADLTGVKAAGAILWESSFRGVRAESSIWQRAELRGADFSAAQLAKAELEEAKLMGADLTCAVLRHARLVKADLRDARLVNCDLLGASLERADLTGATLAHSSLFAAEILDTDTTGADFAHADLGRTMMDPSP